MEQPDFQTLEAELKEHVLDLRQRLLIIDNRFISFDDKIMPCEDIKALRYGIMQMLVFHRLKTDKYYRIDLMDNKDNVMKIFFGYSKLITGDKGREENYDMIINSLWHAVKKRLVNEALNDIRNGKPYSVGSCTLKPEGVELSDSGIFNNRTYMVPWNDTAKKIRYGNFYVYSKSKPSRKCKINFLHTWNSVVMFSLVEYFLSKSG